MKELLDQIVRHLDVLFTIGVICGALFFLVSLALGRESIRKIREDHLGDRAKNDRAGKGQ
jgi:predicted lysophospholipase L1 biosynthesis ABC-type transport system permease subunit